ncbi:MAG: cation diffusion facilitator family transporter [Tannerella sp.]|jgi:cobalt-zinc-cadmium efflux system protein|nr:cation diffusion facilitator family transporter [Tannerella sp.]
MAHEHHTHEHTVSSLNKAFIIGIVLNAAFVVTEFIAGLLTNSMGLLSDAGHNLSDIAGLILAMLAYWLAKAHSNPQYTYGYKKSTILVSLLNAVILLIAVGFIITESIEKLIRPKPVGGDVIIWVAAIGVVINAFTAWLFVKDKEKDLNVKGAYLHMAADALVSIGVMISGAIILFTGWNIIDPVIGILVACVIIYSTWGLLRDSLRLSLDGVPTGIKHDEIEQIIRSVPGVESTHHLHIWALSTTETALTAHVVITDPLRMDAIKHQIKHTLHDKNITHATLEFETKEFECAEQHGDICSTAE